jgi:hypothetical protein
MSVGFRIAAIHILSRNEGEAAKVPSWDLKGERPPSSDMYVLLVIALYAAPLTNFYPRPCH